MLDHQHSNCWCSQESMKDMWNVYLTQVRCVAVRRYHMMNETNFSTPNSRFRFCYEHIGFVAAGYKFCKRGDIALEVVQQCGKVVDNILLRDHNYESHLKRDNEVLCFSNDSKILRYSLLIAGNYEKVKAIADFPEPANLTDPCSDLRSREGSNLFTNNFCDCAYFPMF